jgi:predicted nucleic acid-binding protein
MAGSTLDRVPSGTRIFIDSTVFLHHFFKTSEQCRHLLRRCETRDCLGVTSVVVLLEVTHRLMAMEAVTAGLAPAGKAVRRLQQRPDLLRRLAGYSLQARAVPEFGIEVLPVDLGVCLRAGDVRERDVLLTNDSVIVATMRDARIGAIATGSMDFDRVGGLRVYRPTDIGAAAPPLALEPPRVVLSNFAERE